MNSDDLVKLWLLACGLISCWACLQTERRFLAKTRQYVENIDRVKAAMHRFELEYDVMAIPTRNVLEALLVRAGGMYIGDGSIYGKPGTVMLSCVGCECPNCNRLRRDTIIDILNKMNEQGTCDGGECQSYST